ncbi:MAG TPA: hypothetical protein VFX87_10165 [Methylomirabilota bacterium]|nr:hypothetical protein [Methylomirabilota bacterium]
MSLRLKREPEDEIWDERLPEPSDLLSSEEISPEDGVEVGEEYDRDDENRGLRLLSAVPGPLIAAVTFVPTFLAIFFGLGYLLGGAAPTGPTASDPVPSATALASDPGTQGTPPLPEALRDPLTGPRMVDSLSPRPSDPREPLPGSSAADTPAPAIESTGPTLLPPTQPPAAVSSAPEPRVGRPAEPPRPAQAAVLNAPKEPTPAVEARKSGREWTPAAAFADREAARRLAGSIQQQGYPVEIRQEQSSSRPWVVWIGAQPRGGERRR